MTSDRDALSDRDIPALDEGPLRGLYWRQEADRLRAENERLRGVLERIAYPSDWLQSRGALSSLARRELRGASDEESRSDA